MLLQIKSKSPKMRNLHSCHCLQKFSKYEKATRTYGLLQEGFVSDIE